MAQRIALVISIALNILLVLALYKATAFVRNIEVMMAQQPPPPTVSTASAVQQDWHSYINSVGSLESRNAITVRAEIGGRVTKVAFASGSRVKAGDVLVELDDTVEQAQLKGLVAQAKLAELSLNRARELLSQNTISQAELDAANATSTQAAAAVEQLATLISKKRVIAPFAGRVGITMVNLGQFLGAGDAIVQLDDSSPIYADFGVPQQDIARVQPGMTVSLTVDAFPGREFTGKIEAVNARITDATRNIRVRAVIANNDETLRPGMFARVSVQQPEQKKYVVLPDSAIVPNPYGKSVFVITEKTDEKTGKKNLVAHQRFVQVGEGRGSLISVTSGLEGGEQVVTSGQIKLQEGSTVLINNTISPSANPAPKPEES